MEIPLFRSLWELEEEEESEEERFLTISEYFRMPRKNLGREVGYLP